MPFSPQPRKKGTPIAPQDGTKKPSCGHSVSRDKTPAAKSSDLSDEKQKIALIREKIADKFIKDSSASQKASVILALWISQKK